VSPGFIETVDGENVLAPPGATWTVTVAAGAVPLVNITSATAAVANAIILFGDEFLDARAFVFICFVLSIRSFF